MNQSPPPGTPPAPPPAPVTAAQVPPTHVPLVTFAIVLAVVAALYFGREIFVPFALAVLLSFALAPIMIRLRRWGLGRVPAVLVVVTLAFVAIAGFGTIVALQLYDLADNIPAYQRNMHAKIASLREAAPSGGLVERVTTMLNDLNQQLSGPPPTIAADGSGPAAAPNAVKPVPVEIYRSEASPVEVIERMVAPLFAPIATAGIVLVFVIFMLLEREDLRDRLIRLVGPHDLHRTTEALDDAARRVSRYLLMQLVVNTVYGVPFGIGLFFIGVPNPALWGLLAIILRFIPYLGTFLAAAFPIALSLVVSPGWTMPVETVALFLVIELTVSNIVEPLVYGSTTGISSIAILLAAIFWTWLWGPIGLLLSTPLTTCLVVLGRYVPQLQFLDVMLGNAPVLPVEAKFYQRMLANDPEEAIELAEEFLKTKPLAALYDEVIVGALRLAERDRQRGVLDDEKLRLVAEGTLNVIDYLADYDETPAEPGGGGPGPAAGTAGAADEAPVAPAVREGFTVLCVAARSTFDEAVATMLAQLLSRRGFDARVLPPGATATATLPRFGRERAKVICLSFLHPAALLHARHLCRRVRRYVGSGTKLMVGLWNGQAEAARRQDPLTATGADLLASSLEAAVTQIQALADAETAAPAEAEASLAPRMEAQLGAAGD